MTLYLYKNIKSEQEDMKNVRNLAKVNNNLYH